MTYPTARVYSIMARTSQRRDEYNMTAQRRRRERVWYELRSTPTSVTQELHKKQFPNGSFVIDAPMIVIILITRFSDEDHVMPRILFHRANNGFRNSLELSTNQPDHHAMILQTTRNCNFSITVGRIGIDYASLSRLRNTYLLPNGPMRRLTQTSSPFSRTVSARIKPITPLNRHCPYTTFHTTFVARAKILKNDISDRWYDIQASTSLSHVGN